METPSSEVTLQEAHPDLAPKSPAEAPAAAAEPAAHSEAAKGEDSELEAKPSKLAQARTFLSDLFGSLFSSDAPTRKTALLFFIGVLGAMVVSVALVRRYQHVRTLQAIERKKLEEEEKHQAEIEKNRLADLKVNEGTLSLGRFVIAIKPSGRGSSERPTADFELIVRCNEKEVKEYVEARSVQVHNELVSALVGMSREDFLAVDGKRRTHKKILSTLNQWLAHEYSGARVEEVWFSDLVVE